MRTSARTRYVGYRFPAEIIGHGVWLYFRFPLRQRMVEELLAARGIIVSHETIRGRRANRKTAAGHCHENRSGAAAYRIGCGMPPFNYRRHRFPPEIIQLAIW